jgi:uncharacterized protein involved in response to NO
MSKATSSAEQIRGYQGPAILGYGFRPFFLSAALWAVLAMLLWIAALAGWVPLPSHLSALDWHIHELLFGYLPAVVAGFLLTAIPNWTGSLPVVGWRLLLLMAVWWLGRAALLFPAALGVEAAAALDLLFLLSLIGVAGREILAGKNWRNLRVLVLVALLWAANLLFHMEAAYGSAAGGYGVRLGLSAGLLLIILVGGRIIPSFTRNWLAKRSAAKMPASFGAFDAVVIVLSAAALGLWVFLLESTFTAGACLVAGAAHCLRQARWRPLDTGAEALVWVLHLAYLFVPLGFLALGAAMISDDLLPASAALHLWTAGAIGVMTLAVMTRASLGHSGRPLTASAGIQVLYLLAAGAALARLIGGLAPGTLWVLELSGLLWACAFGLFLALFFPLLARRKG